MLPKLVLTDIDGVWTDGGMYYGESGDEFKKFNTSDSAGVLLLASLGVPTGIVTGERTRLVERRAMKLNIPYLYQGVSDKLECARRLCARLDMSLDQVAFIGDDLGDIHLLAAVGMSGCPANAPSYVKAVAKMETKRSGGEGAFREFVEHLLEQAGMLELALRVVIGEPNPLGMK